MELTLLWCMGLLVQLLFRRKGLFKETLLGRTGLFGQKLLGRGCWGKYYLGQISILGPTKIGQRHLLWRAILRQTNFWNLIWKQWNNAITFTIITIWIGRCLINFIIYMFQNWLSKLNFEEVRNKGSLNHHFF